MSAWPPLATRRVLSASGCAPVLGGALRAAWTATCPASDGFPPCPCAKASADPAAGSASMRTITADGAAGEPGCSMARTSASSTPACTSRDASAAAARRRASRLAKPWLRGCGPRRGPSPSPSASAGDRARATRRGSARDGGIGARIVRERGCGPDSRGCLGIVPARGRPVPRGGRAAQAAWRSCAQASTPISRKACRRAGVKCSPTLRRRQCA